MSKLSNALKKQQSADSAYSTNTGSAESNYSQPSFDSFDEIVDREFAAAGLRAGHAQSQCAASVLERCKNKPVAFAIRTNIEYIPAREDNCPIRENAIQFDVKDFIHIKDKYDAEWWVGRLVKVGSPLGFVPSPMKLERIRLHMNRKTKMMSASGTKNKSFNSGDMADVLDAEAGEELDTNKPKANMFNTKEKKKPFFRKALNLTAPYDVVPNMRPVILVGPSLKGYDVTDMMQKAVFDFLRRRYEGSIIITKVTADISMAKRTGAGGLGGRSGLSVMDRGSGARNPGAREVSDEIERIFELARSLHLLILDCDTINHPAQMQKTSLAPIIAYLKVSSPKVLQKLIKSRGKSQTRNLNVQLVAAEKLTQCPPEAYDIILDQNQLEEACNHFAEYLDNYWEATHPKYDDPKESKMPPLPTFSSPLRLPVINPVNDESSYKTIATLHTSSRKPAELLDKTNKPELSSFPIINGNVSGADVFTVPTPSKFNTLTMPPNTILSPFK